MTTPWPPLSKSSVAATGIRYFPWIGLSLVLVAFVSIVFWARPANLFGFMQDDTIYFSTAGEIASGHGYVMPSVPGRPTATKYPVIYPWVLSWVWRVNPSFPSNVSLAAAVSLLFGCVFIVATFLFFRRMAGISANASVLLTALCALSPELLFSSSMVMSDVPFAAVSLLAFLLASRSVPGADRFSAAGSGLLTGVAMLIRTMGAPVAIGIFIAITIRSGWKKGLAFCCGFLPGTALMWWLNSRVAPVPPGLISGDCLQSWRMTWLYYTNYVGFWNADAVQNHTLWSLGKANLFLSVLQPGSYVLSGASWLGSSAVASTGLLVMVSAIIFRGLVRERQKPALQPAYWALLFYMGPVLVWDFSDSGRFLLPFLPLFICGLCVEIRHLAAKIRESQTQGLGPAERGATLLLMIVAGTVAVVGAGSWWRVIHGIRNLSDYRAGMLVEKKEAYAWLKEHTPKESRVIAYEDVLVYLYSGRTALRPVIFSPAGLVRPGILERDSRCLQCSAAAIGARYWIVADDDFRLDWQPASSRAAERERSLEPSMALVFSSTRGRVRVYDLEATQDGRRL